MVEFVKPSAPPAPPPPPPPPPSTCAPCPACSTTTPPPPPELQCPVCTCIPVYFGGSYGRLVENEQSSYSCSRAHLPQIIGISRTFNNYFGALSCPTKCFADCGNTYHCCVAPPPPPPPPTTTTTAAVSTCFPSAARVTLENGQSVTMSQLQVGDRVQTGKLWINVSHNIHTN